MGPNELPPIPAPPDENLTSALLEEVASWGWVHQGQAEWQRVADGAEGLALLQAASEEYPEPVAPAEAPDRPDPTAQAHIRGAREARARTERQNEAQRAYAERELVRQPARLRWPQQRPAFPRANEDEARRLIRRYIRQLIGPLPWVRRVFPCSVTAVDKAAKTCTVEFAERGAAGPLPGVGYGSTAPTVGGEYALRWPVKLPDDPDVSAQPRLYGRPWIKVPGGFVRWLYYRIREASGTDTLWRIKWPPVAVPPDPAPEPQQVTALPGASPAGRNGNVGGRRNGAAGGLIGYHTPTRALWHANLAWTQFAGSGLAPAGTDTHFTVLADWGTGTQTLVRPNRNIFPVAVNPDLQDADHPERVALAGWEPDPALVDVGPPELPFLQWYDPWADLVVSQDSAASWTVLERIEYQRIVPDPFRFGFNAFQNVHSFGTLLYYGWTLAAGEDASGLAAADAPVLPFLIWAADPFVPPVSSGSGFGVFNQFLPGLRVWTPAGGLQPVPINAPRHALTPAQLAGWAIRADGAVDLALALPLDDPGPNVPGPDLPTGYTEFIHFARRPPDEAFTWGEIAPYRYLRAMSRDGQAVVASASVLSGPRYFSDDYGATWTALPEPLHTSLDVDTDLLLVDIPQDDEFAEEVEGAS